MEEWAKGTIPFLLNNNMLLKINTIPSHIASPFLQFLHKIKTEIYILQNVHIQDSYINDLR